MGLRSEIRKVKSVVAKTVAPHCLSGFFTLNFHLLRYLLDDLERFRSLSSMVVGLVENLNVLIKKPYTMTSRRPSTRMHETVENRSSEADGVQRPGSEVQRAWLAHLC